MAQKPVRKSGEDLRDLPTYTVPESAAYLGIPERTLRSWFSSPRPLWKPAGRTGTLPLLSFRDLAQAHIVQVARQYHDVSMDAVRTAIRTATKESSSRYPLLDENIKIFAKNLILEQPGRGRRKRKIINLSEGGQLGIPKVIDLYSRRILRNEKGEPIQIFPWRFAQGDKQSKRLKKPVAIDPGVMSGRLVVTGTRIPVQVLWCRKLSGESVRDLADDYGLSPETVKRALRHIATKAA